MDRKGKALELIDRFRYADDWRQQYDDKAIEWYKIYVGYRESRTDGRSNIHVPLPYEEVDTLRSRLLKSCTSTRPYMDFVPSPYGPLVTPEIMTQNEEKAELAASVVDMQLERNQYPVKLYDFITSLLVFPAAIMGVGWRYEKKKTLRKKSIALAGLYRIPLMTAMARLGQDVLQRLKIYNTVEEVEVVEWDDNELTYVDYFDFWPDPRGTDVDSCRFVFQREWATKEQIETKLNLLSSLGKGEVYFPTEEEWEQIAAAGGALEEGRRERLEAIGLVPETRQGYDAKDTEKNLYELLHYWEDDRHAIIINRQELLSDGPSPYWRHGKKPFVVTGFEKMPGEFYYKSAIAIIEHLSAELDTHRNQRIDNVSLVLNRMWKVRRSADIDESELVSRPNGIVWVDNMEDVAEFAMQDVTSSSYQEEQITRQDAENALGVPAVVRGVTSAREETATEVVTKNSNASIRFDVKIMLFEALGLKRLAYLMDCNNQQFIDQPRLVRLYGEEGVQAWRQIQPWEILGEFDYRPSGANVDPAANKEVRRQQLGQLIQQAVQLQIPFANLFELWKTYTESFDLRNTQKYIKTPEEIQQEQLQQQMAMQQAQQEQIAQQQAMQPMMNEQQMMGSPQ